MIMLIMYFDPLGELVVGQLPDTLAQRPNIVEEASKTCIKAKSGNHS